MSTKCENCEENTELRTELKFYEGVVIQLKQMLEHEKMRTSGRKLLKYENGQQQTLSDVISMFEGER